jgi:DNA (cytosine-5)-methyltransferase 1
MNGLLERKLNEVCFFYEVDLDDQRPPEEQSAIEVSVNMVKDLRSVRKTNQLFPACRNITLEDFRNQLQAAKEGGLTARWKYTCTYASAADRWDNNLKERTLEVLRERECTSGFGVSDIMQRFGWRGETIPGGAYLPDLHVEKELIETSRKESVISLASSTPESESDCLIIESPTASAKIAGKRHIDLSSSITPTPCRKRRPSSLNEGLAQDESRNNSKKVRIENEKEVEVTRRELSTLHVEEEVIVLGKASDMVDMTVDASSSQSQPRSLVATNIAPLRYSQHSAASKIALAIDVSSSELASPPPTGAVQYGPISEKGTVFRSPGQMLTYGDAFCGAGGTTRGAAMAGLRVVWGFDHWNQACSTWRANFPYATCYELTSQRFIVTTQGSKFRKPVDVKVDVLHLSPPCQYFSPAHTVNCPNDEMNIASLFAVGAVIKAARPRIVTLEQTFGIVATRFYRYFNSLIHMFTALNFSVRWAVVPLAQWARSKYFPSKNNQES